MTVTVRSAMLTDVELLQELARQTFPLACPSTTTADAIAKFIAEHLSAESFRGYLNDDARQTLIAEVDGQPAGYALFCTDEPRDPDVAHALTVRPTIELSKCYVLAEFHGAGVARELIAGGISRAQTQGFAAMWLGVNQENVRANRFYEKMGFQLVGTKKFLVGERWEDDYVRERIFTRHVESA
ncbi:GNAT family N-acetyltransferase [Salinibacterium sp. PAMC 21357]|uniref:GNAT family N-acetyltransferase n=1 Tax=Salinibacterium sp. PAMC 21357 TaxID=1112215 RepID=UPI000288BF42|nr:GNAT family N-acetyltransferase [Salinibacterium sp. PAMC 21357]